MSLESMRQASYPKQFRLTLKCPECEWHLISDELEHKHAWCVNPDCKLFIKRMPPYDLMFSKAGESFLSLRESE
jgi:hypothetical protein